MIGNRINDLWIAEEISDRVRSITGDRYPCRWMYDINVDGMRFVCGPFAFNVQPNTYGELSISEAQSKLLSEVILPVVCPHGY